MADNIRRGLDNPHPFSRMKTELIWYFSFADEGLIEKYEMKAIREL